MDFNAYEIEQKEKLNDLVNDYKNSDDSIVKTSIINCLVSIGDKCAITHSFELAGLFYAKAADFGHLAAMINAAECLEGADKERYFLIAKSHYNDFDDEGKEIIDEYFNK